MRKHFLAAGIAAVTLIPTFAAAQQTCEERRNNRVAGTVVGGVLGAIAGSAVAGHGDRNEGAVIGGLGGAIVGNQLSKGSADCQHAYGYYDNNDNWHANAVRRDQAQGYYDRNGNWVNGPPRGSWDNNGRWSVAPDAYRHRDDAIWRNAPSDLRGREDWLVRRIERARDNRRLSASEARDARRKVEEIRHDERRMRRDGRLTRREEDRLMARLDEVNRQIRWDRRD